MKLRRFVSFFIACSILLTALTLPVSAAPDIDIDAKAALLVDGESGAVLYAQNEHAELSQASLTKVMTTLLALEAVERGDLTLDTKITATDSALYGLAADGSNADPAIVSGETLTLDQLIYCMMVVSANEACNIVAEAVSGSTNAFVDLMNQRAMELGCKNTHFANTCGLTAIGHYSSAWDIYLIAKEAMKYEKFQNAAYTTWYEIPPTNKCEKTRVFHTTNSLLDSWRISGYEYGPARGIKTGHTEDAGYCLVSLAAQGSRTLYGVILGAEVGESRTTGNTVIQSFAEMARLFSWGFENFVSKTVLEDTELIQEVPVSLSKESNYVVVHPAYTAMAMLPVDLDPAEMHRTVTLYNEVARAPIVAGDELGTITVSYDGVDYVTVPLLALADVSSNNFLVGKDAIKRVLSDRRFQLGVVLLILLVAAFMVWWKILRRQRRYGKAKDKRRRRQRSYHGRRF